MDYYFGLDVSLKTVAVCVINADGKLIFERSVACEIEDIVECLGDVPSAALHIGFEAGPMCQHLFRGLRAAGFDVVCMEARQVNAALSAMRNKTDKTDARGIAQVLRSGWFNPVYIKSREAHALRALLSSRKAIQKKCIDLANEVRGLFKIFGIRLSSRVKQGSCDEQVRPLVEADPDLSHALLPLLDARAVLYTIYRELYRRVKQAANRDEACMRFMAIPGVGPIAALTFRAAVDDPWRFTSSRTVAAHFGLTPRRYQSGEKDNPGRISKAGASDVRATLYSAANAMMMRWIGHARS